MGTVERQRALRLLADAIGVEDTDAKAIDLEAGAFERTLEFTKRNGVIIWRNWSDPLFVRVYNEICRSLLSNLVRHPSLDPNSTLRDALDSGRVTARNAAGMTGFERNPVLWQDAVFSSASTNPLCDFKRSGIHTTEHPCPNCNKCDASYIEVQIRSSDEPATLIITCNECMQTWRV